MKSVVRRISGRSYVVSKQIAIARMHRGDRPLVVFSMGKTGSTAIARAVQDATGARAFQVFRLVPDRLAEAEARYRADARPPYHGALHLWESEYLLRRPPTPAAPWTLITTVREPVAQAVSAFFHGGGRRGVLDAGSATDELVHTMLDEQWLRPPRRWFDREFAPALGVDVFAQPFDPVLGHAVVETPAVRVLLLRQESFAVAPEVLGKFLGRGGPVPVAARNEASTKQYAEQYRRFLAAVRLPGPVLDQAYSSRYARHFYADSELERFRQRWADGPGAAASSG